MKVLIAGGGIGGVTAALCLARNGCEVQVFEQTPVLSEIGAGIQLSPNCSRVLHSLGLQDALQVSGFLPEGTQFRSWRSGKVISESPLGDTALKKYGAPYYHLHRGDLLALLVNAAEQLSNIQLTTNTRVIGCDQSTDSIRLRTASAEHAGDLLIGADGIHSLIRAELWGQQQATFTGNIAWRALVPASRLPDGMVRPMSTAWWGPGKHFVHYYVKGGELVNCVCVVEKDGWAIESWTERGDYEELKSDFTGWHNDIQTLIDSADRDSLYKWALYDRPPMDKWGHGRVTLLGDACHPTLPFMAQGAAMAIEDGAVLAACLKQADDVSGALRKYEALRRARTARIQIGSRRNAKVFHLSGIKAWARNLAAGRASGSAMDGLFGYNALEAAN